MRRRSARSTYHLDAMPPRASNSAHAYRIWRIGSCQSGQAKDSHIVNGGQSGRACHQMGAPARVIDLGTVRHANPYYPFYAVGTIHSLGAIIIWARDGVFSVDIESKRVTKLCEDTRTTACFVPYMSFLTPGTHTIQLCSSS